MPRKFTPPTTRKLTPPSFHLHSSPLSICSGLGHGAYGTIYLAQTHPSIQSPSLVAVKYLPQSHLTLPQKQLQRQEAFHHITCSSHPNVLSVYAVHELPQHDAWYMVLQYAPYGDLFDFVSSGAFTTWVNKTKCDVDTVIVDIFHQICDAVMYCHAKGVYHRDLKPENILITELNEETGRIKVCLCDFGLATREPLSKDYGCGSVFYMSPECQLDHERVGYDVAACDVWSLGVLLVNLTCKQNPWHRADMDLTDLAYRHYVAAQTAGVTMQERRARALMDLLPVSSQFAKVLSCVFEPKVEARCSVDKLRAMVTLCAQGGFLMKLERPVMGKRASLYSLNGGRPLEELLAEHDEDVVDVHPEQNFGCFSSTPSGSSVISACSDSVPVWLALPHTPIAQHVSSPHPPTSYKSVHSNAVDDDESVYSALGI